MARVLLVEDEPSLRFALAHGLRQAGFSVLDAADAREGWARLDEADVVVLDRMLPDEDGLNFLARLRRTPRYERMPVLMLTARASERDRVEGLLGGADDYLTKPFSTAELAARLVALLRRSRGAEVLRRGELVVDTERGRVTLGGREVGLTRREFDLLAFLARDPGRVYDRETLLEQVWGPDFLGTLRTVDQHVAQLREKLGGRWIETVRGKGYRFTEAP
ncbi:response regulator transcription factor [Oceanithermus profundus]